MTKDDAMTSHDDAMTSYNDIIRCMQMLLFTFFDCLCLLEQAHSIMLDHVLPGPDAFGTPPALKRILPADVPPLVGGRRRITRAFSLSDLRFPLAPAVAPSRDEILSLFDQTQKTFSA